MKQPIGFINMCMDSDPSPEEDRQFSGPFVLLQCLTFMNQSLASLLITFPPPACMYYVRQKDCIHISSSTCICKLMSETQQPIRGLWRLFLRGTGDASTVGQLHVSFTSATKKHTIEHAKFCPQNCKKGAYNGQSTVHTNSGVCNTAYRNKMQLKLYTRLT